MSSIDKLARPEFIPSPLNIETTRRYEACKAQGGHVRSDKIIHRDIGINESHPFIICARCGVPVSKKQVTFNGRVMRDGRPAKDQQPVVIA